MESRLSFIWWLFHCCCFLEPGASHQGHGTHSQLLKVTDDVSGRSYPSYRDSGVQKLTMSPKPTFASLFLRFRRSSKNDSDEQICYKDCHENPVVPLCEDEDENWLVGGDENDWDYDVGYRVLFALFYLLILFYLFVGVSIVSDIFMSSIEVITSKEKTIAVQTESGEVVTMQVHVWNDTVANLTLMALGSSAPEILLAIVEVVVDDFQAGLLGPGTVLGSAAYNFFIIIAICILSVKNGETKKIEKYRVFLFTCVFSIWAYIWMFMILKWISPCLIDIWEAFLTLAFFPLFVLIAWRIDKSESKKLEMARNLMIEGQDVTEASETPSRFQFADKSISVLESERITEGEKARVKKNWAGVSDIETSKLEAGNKSMLGSTATKTVASDYFARNPGRSKFRLTNTRKQEFLYRFQMAKKEKPDLDDEEILDEVARSMLESSRKSKVYYRLIALGVNKELNAVQHRKNQRRTWNFNRTRTTRSQRELDSVEVITHRTGRKTQATPAGDPNPNAFKVRFDPAEYVVAEDMGTVTLFVFRLLNKGNTVAEFNTVVDFKTVDGTAKAGSDYIAKKGTLQFEPGEFIKTIDIEIVNDEIFEDEEYFSVFLSNLINFSADKKGPGRVRSSPSGRRSSKRQSVQEQLYPCILASEEARVIILDEDHRGIFAFEHDQEEVEEKAGEIVLTVKRFKGARGIVEVPYQTDEFTAKPSVDYEHTEGVLRFENGEVSKTIIVPIINTSEYEKDTIFNVMLSEPKTITTEQERYAGRQLTKQERTVDLKGEARLGNKDSCLVTIVENSKLKRRIDEMSERLTVSDLIKKTTYCDQFKQAFTVQGDEDEETGEVKPPTKCNWCCHILTMFWKVLFALIPPPGQCGGWGCFAGSLMGIGLLTYVIEIVATNVGCAAGLKDIVTAITIVALGTSLPDTFASRAAALADDNADAAIGNVTGSNAVNVFLGIGVAWLLGAIVQQARGCTFYVDPGDLGFNVVVFVALVLVGVGILLYRRFSRSIAAELGGPVKSKVICALIMILLWVVYITLATLSSYAVITPGF